MEKKLIDPTTINGWGIDADPDDQPNYPIKTYTGDDHNRKNWQRPALQPEEVEILKSTERPYLSAVFGTGNPPRFLSGIIRRFAFKYSENMFRHWLPLLLADRVDVIESNVEDMLHARIANQPRERGWSAIGEHNPAALSKKILVGTLMVAAVAGYLAYNMKDSSHETE